MSHWNPFGPADPHGPPRTAEVYFGPSARPDPESRFGEDAPQAFLVEMGADSELRTHYHPIDQYQVFVSGTGRFGRHAVAPGIVHYSDANTPYGPLSADGHGVGFLTLRGRTDSGASYMPESRDELRVARESDPRAGHRRRNLTLTDWPSPDQRGWQWSLEESDGARAGHVTLEPAETSTIPAVKGAGAYLVVWNGDLVAVRSTDASAGGSLMWLAPSSPAQTIIAGDDGAIVSMLQLPTPIAASARSDLQAVAS